MRVWKKGKRGHPTYQPCYKAAGILDSGTGTAPSTYGCPISIAGAFRRSHVSSPAGSNGYVTGRPPVRNPVVVVVFPQARSLLSLFYPVSVIIAADHGGHPWHSEWSFRWDERVSFRWGNSLAQSNPITGRFTLTNQRRYWPSHPPCGGPVRPPSSMYKEGEQRNKKCQRMIVWGIQIFPSSARNLTRLSEKNSSKSSRLMNLLRLLAASNCSS